MIINYYIRVEKKKASKKSNKKARNSEMEVICEYIKMLRKPYTEDDLYFQVMECGAEMDMRVNDMRRILNKKIGKSIREVKVFKENEGMQRKVIISFRYKKFHCEILEHFDTQRDFLCVRITPIETTFN